ncbi:hypothetical protein K8089_10025 [Aequorivita sp. F47161]|uniref:Uncharacterized protein n=1 Tax=Aequorivita vitellina TaxID=2874475 RepID=A0A9X1U1X9_9FLAO|nr:hypothetical protein [Aequorivita vitellina]MCG2419360.1 hypothetical protein [Aequorivita vitellina]
MTQPQQDFLKNEIWMLTFGGAFQRNKVYAVKVSEKQREVFRKELRSYFEKEILPAYDKRVEHDAHCAMIEKIVTDSSKYESILEEGNLSVGTAQKLLNLVLKYYWCLGLLPEPPHFPIDSRIQSCLPVKNRMSWTKITSLDEYQTIIDCAKEQLKEGETLARWELANFKRI